MALPLVAPGPHVRLQAGAEGDGPGRAPAQPPMPADVIEHAADQPAGHLLQLTHGGLQVGAGGFARITHQQDHFREVREWHRVRRGQHRRGVEDDEVGMAAQFAEHRA